MDYQLNQVRAAMAAGGAGRKPLLVTEIGVASDGFYPSVFVKGFEGQARFLHEAFARLLAMRHRWRIAGVDWFTWQDQPNPDPHCSFCQGAGLFDRRRRPEAGLVCLPARGARRRRSASLAGREDLPAAGRRDGRARARGRCRTSAAG